jgi:hypothetical protein
VCVLARVICFASLLRRFDGLCGNGVRLTRLRERLSAQIRRRWPHLGKRGRDEASFDVTRLWSRVEDFQGPKSSWRSPALRSIGLEQRLTAEILLAETHGTQPPSVNGVDDVRAIGDWHESRAGAAGDKSETSCPGSALNPLALAAESSTRIVPDMPRKTREERAKCHLAIAAAWSRQSWEVCLLRSARGDLDEAL